MKIDEKQFKIICKKLDKISVAIAIQNIKDKDEKIAFLKKLGLTSAEIGPLVGMTESGIRDSKGWKKK